MNNTVETPDKLWHIDQFQILKALSMKEKMNLEELMCMTEYKKGDEVYLPSQTVEEIYFLKKGHIKISKLYEEGNEQVLEVIGKGELFGKYLPGDELANANEKAIALDDCVLCYLDTEKWNDFITSNSSFSLNVLKIVGLKFKKLESRLEDLQFKNAEARIATVIHNLTEKFGRKIGVGFETELQLNLTHQDLAKLSSTSRQSVTTYLRSLEKENIISYNRKRILIKDMEKLKAMV